MKLEFEIFLQTMPDIALFEAILSMQELQTSREAAVATALRTWIQTRCKFKLTHMHHRS